MSATDQDDTAELPTFAPGAVPDQSISASVRVEIAGLSHPGKVRPNNEDHFLVGRFGRFLEILQTNLPPGEIPKRVEEIGYAMVVADGVGGSAAGEVASKLAISTLIHLFLQTPDWVLRLEEDQWVQEVQRRAAERYEQVNAALSEQARRDPELRGFATTLTMAASLGRLLVVAHVGDSRAYLLRAGELHQLTRDHTMAQSMAQVGLISPNEATTHRLRHVLLKALGAPDREVDPDVHEHTLEDKDCVLLCSDGLTEMVDETTIAAVLTRNDPAQQTCELLVDEALRAGGKDNVTAVCARYQFV